LNFVFCLPFQGPHMPINGDKPRECTWSNHDADRLCYGFVFGPVNPSLLLRHLHAHSENPPFHVEKNFYLIPHSSTLNLVRPAASPTPTEKLPRPPLRIFVNGRRVIRSVNQLTEPSQPPLESFPLPFDPPPCGSDSFFLRVFSPPPPLVAST